MVWLKKRWGVRRVCVSRHTAIFGRGSMENLWAAEPLKINIMISYPISVIFANEKRIKNTCIVILPILLRHLVSYHILIKLIWNINWWDYIIIKVTFTKKRIIVKVIYELQCLFFYVNYATISVYLYLQVSRVLCQLLDDCLILFPRLLLWI